MNELSFMSFLCVDMYVGIEARMYENIRVDLVQYMYM